MPHGGVDVRDVDLALLLLHVIDVAEVGVGGTGCADQGAGCRRPEPSRPRNASLLNSLSFRRAVRLGDSTYRVGRACSIEQFNDVVDGLNLLRSEEEK